MVGNQLDTMCTGIVNEQQLFISSPTISDLSGIKYFDNLNSLTLCIGLLDTLPELPGGLKTLTINGSAITTLSLIHNSIKILNINNNRSLSAISSLPDSLEQFNCYYDSLLVNFPLFPNSIRSIAIVSCGLTNLPTLPTFMDSLLIQWNNLNNLPSLPGTLKYIDCSNNRLNALSILPAGLKVLECDNNMLSNLPVLPPTLQLLSCYNNMLSILPSLPQALRELYCGNNQLSILPSLPDSLRSLECSFNMVTALPQLPQKLNHLGCSDNNLTVLPALPEFLVSLNCANNHISCFPPFPLSIDPTTGMAVLHISGNPFTCLPNYLPVMEPYLYAFPLCANDSVTNAYGCSPADAISGFTYKDLNNNCSRQASDSIIRNVHIQRYNSLGVMVDQTYSTYSSFYTFASNDTGSYRIQLDTTGLPYTYECLNPGMDSTLEITSANHSATDINFNLICKPGYDLGVHSIIPTGSVFPGMPHILRINAGDLSQWFGLNCAAGIGGQVQINIAGPVTYGGVLAGALTPAIAGNTFTYTISDFGAIDNATAFLLLMNTNSTAQLGDSICVSVSVTPVTGDINQQNNTLNFCYKVRNSHDPNIKETYPEFVIPGYQDYFTYTIYFQNSGTASAQRIVLNDYLDTNLLAETFELINYSHKNIISLKPQLYSPGNELSVSFNNIMLPDSASDPEGSIGFIQYRIRPKSNLPAGTRILNAANIFFDYNSFVSTNTTVNDYILPTGVDENIIRRKINVYPNPGMGIFNFDGIEKGTQIEIFDISGRVVYSSEIENNRVKVDMSTKDKGLYIYKIWDANSGIQQGKIILY